MLDAVVAYLPSPVDVPAIKGEDAAGNEVLRKAVDTDPLALLAFIDLYRVDRPFIRGTVLMNQSDDPIRYTADESIRFLHLRAI